jgi:hypothetical protein
MSKERCLKEAKGKWQKFLVEFMSESIKELIEYLK